MLYLVGYRPSYKCKAAPNDTLFNNTEKWREYGQCSIKTFTNSSEGVAVTETGCDNGWDYDIPVEQSFVTQVSFLSFFLLHIHFENFLKGDDISYF